MGVPIESQPASSKPNPSSTTSSTAPPDPSSLPPEALALASRLFDLARNGSTPELEQYLTAGIPPNLTNHEGNTLLMLAAYSGHANTVSMLIERGADVNALNAKGQSPLAGACFKGWDEVIGVLDRARADREKGQPSAVDCVRMFKLERWRREWGLEEGMDGWVGV